MTPPTGPLTDAEFDELDEFLMSEALPEETMDVAMLDGFLTALAIGPNLLEPGQWLPEIWGGSEAVVWESPEQAAHIMGMILRHWNFLLAQFQAEPDAYAPVVYTSEENGKEVSIVDEWCIGFVRGINLDDEAWQPILEELENDGAAEFLLPIMLYGTDTGWEEMEQNPALAARHADFAATLPDNVLAIYDYWAPERAGRTTVRNEAPKVGRNDLCPCGSGRKYKKCCGAPGRLN